MSYIEDAEPKLGKFKPVAPRAIRLAPEALITTCGLNPLETFPLVIQPNVEHLNLAAWASHDRLRLEALLLKHGALLFRGFNVDSVEQFERVARAMCGELLEYRERAAPRSEVGHSIYTSTEYPADQYIPLHHEMSYSHHWPTKIMFFCQQPAEQGGRTPIASDRKVFRLIDPQIKEEFMRKKVMYVRNYGEGVDLPWQEVFGTSDRLVVEDYCRKARMEFEWIGGSRLRTRQIRQAVASHPQTGETVWFNHAHMFHVSNLEPTVRASLLSEFKPDELPRNAFYGDGSPIDSAVLREIREIYRREAVSFQWQRGDIMLLDNFLASHGREPFAGPRKVLVAMAELYTNPEI